MAIPLNLGESKVRSDSFVEGARHLVEKGNIDSALDLIYDQIDEMLRKAEFSKLDLVLAELPVSDLSIDLLLGILTATLPARSRLSNRAHLFAEIVGVLTERREYQDGLLTGLE
jgi:hypothetical protein